jgi:transcription elongation factor GreA
MADTYPMTPAGLEKLRRELKQIKEVDRHDNVREIEAALEHGDLKENAEYHAAKERQANLDARMRYLEARVGMAQVIDPSKIQSEKVGFGATVTLLDLDKDAEITYAIVGEDESDADNGRVSVRSPIARAMLQKQVGDDVVVHLPKGDREFEVVKIEYKALD